MSHRAPGYALWGLTPKEDAMKVRYKDCTGPYDYTVVEESPHYYIVYGTFGTVAVSKADYKPVQEWVDVTSLHEGSAVATLLQDPGYRLVRREVGNLRETCKTYAYVLEKVKR